MEKKWKCESECDNQCEVKMEAGERAPNSCIYTWGGIRKFKFIDKKRNEKPKEPELMTMSRALTEKKEQDLLKWSDTGSLIEVKTGGCFRYKKSGEKVDFMPKHLIERKWQIIHASPKVLSAEQWVSGEYGNDPDYPSEDFINCFKSGDKNGQLKVREERKELMNAIQEWLADIYQNTSSKVDHLYHARKIDYARSIKINH